MEDLFDVEFGLGYASQQVVLYVGNRLAMSDNRVIQHYNPRAGCIKIMLILVVRVFSMDGKPFSRDIHSARTEQSSLALNV